MRTITIEIDETTGYTIREGDRYCSHLGWDEMLGSIAELTHPRVGAMRYRMQTTAECQAEEAARSAKPPADDSDLAEPIRF